MSSDPANDLQPAPAPRRTLGLALVAVVLVGAAFFGGRELSRTFRRPPAPAPAPAGAPSTAATPPAPIIAEAPAPIIAEAPAPEAKRRAPRRTAAPVPAPAAPAAPATGELRIESDVAGAMVFLDRVYLGTAPVTASNLAPGPHHLNVSAEGYDGYSEAIQVAPGPGQFTVRFKEIRLNEAIDVVHRHGLGSCEGRLLADPQGVRYETSNRDDAFSMKFAEIEVFQVDYLKKNLRVKRRGGKTWNFTTKTENADPLFVFHRSVDKVRLQVAK